MTTNWKPTIHQAYTTPNLSNPILQQAIPSLIRDEIHRLANITLFQNNVHSNHNASQVPVDMRFTDNSLNIRLSKNAPWISLLPSTNPLTLEEQTVDAIRRDVMEKIAFLWGGIPDSSSDESNHQDTNSFGSSGRNRNSRSTRTRSKRSKRAQQNRGMRDSGKSPITISKNKIDSSTHTTNNYYCCHSGSQHLLSTLGKAETQGPRKGMHIQIDPTIDLSKNFEQIHSPEESRHNVDSSHDESKESSTSSSDAESRMGNKASTSRNFDQSDTSDLGSESTSSDKSEKSSMSSVSSKTLSQPDLKVSNDSLEKTDFDLEIEDLTQQFGKLQINDPKDSSRVCRTRSMPDAGVTADPMPTLSQIPSKAEDLFAAIKKFIKQYNTESKPVSQRRALLELQNELAQERPNIAKVNNLLSFLEADSLQLEIEMGIQKQRKVYTHKSAEGSLDSIHNVEELISIEDISRLHAFINDSISETDAFIEIANSIEEEIDPQTISSLLRNRDILIDMQNLLDSDPQLVIGSYRVNMLLDQLHLDTLQLIYNDSDVEIPYINREDSSDGESTLMGSVETVFENENAVDGFIDDEIRNQPLPNYMRVNVSSISEEKGTNPEIVSTKDQDTTTEEHPTRDSSSNTIAKTLKAVSTETDVDITIPKTTQAIGTQASSIAINQDIQTDPEIVSTKDQDTITEEHPTRDSSSNTIAKTLKAASTETDVDITIPKTTQAIGTQASSIAINQDIQTDPEIVSTKDQDTITEEHPTRDSSSNTIAKTLKAASTETDVDITIPKTTQAIGTQMSSSTIDQEAQTEQRKISIDESAEGSLDSIHNVEELISIEDISRLHAFINDSISETDAFIEIANSIEEEINPQTTSSLLRNRDILIDMQNLLDSDPQLVIGSYRVNMLLDQLHLDTLQLIYNDSDVEIPYINREDSSDGESTLMGSVETVFENENAVDGFIDDEIRNQPLPNYMRVNTLTDEDADELDSLLDSNLFTEETSNNEVRTTSTQTDTYVTDDEIQLQEKLRKLQTVLERTKSIHKEELASLLRAQDRLQSEANEKITGVLQSSIESEKDAFSRLQDSHEKYTKLLKDTSIEIADLKKTLAELETIDSAKKTEVDSFRSKVHSPMPTAIKVETKTEATQVNDMSASTDIDVKSTITKAKPTRATASSSNSNQNDRNLAATSITALRKEKVALEFAIQKNQFPKSQLAGKKDLLKQIDEELIRRNQSPKSKKNAESISKKPLNQIGRNRIDLGKEAFIKQQDTLNNKRTNHK